MNKLLVANWKLGRDKTKLFCRRCEQATTSYNCNLVSVVACKSQFPTLLIVWDWFNKNLTQTSGLFAGIRFTLSWIVFYFCDIYTTAGGTRQRRIDDAFQGGCYSSAATKCVGRLGSTWLCRRTEAVMLPAGWECRWGCRLWVQDGSNGLAMSGTPWHSFEVNDEKIFLFFCDCWCVDWATVSFDLWVQKTWHITQKDINRSKRVQQLQLLPDVRTLIQ